ncbi:DUF3883 domain-containing protein [Trichonephila inaurata madagascariensis]|uniref:DUF3883 domain-containing protein n=1 Tax=Trichonephila inaurata madagascariensis TaxID=2747483 RepID=A0A8X6Y7H5_9ARAC|nr:DUF3883 domain-containing protein [Trichonephila inaurata madagascariensis]
MSDDLMCNGSQQEHIASIFKEYTTPSEKSDLHEPFEYCYSNCLSGQTKNSTFVSPENALLEDNETPIPDFSMLNPIDNKCLPLNNANLMDWLVRVHDKLNPIDVLRNSILKWIKTGEINKTNDKKTTAPIIEFAASHYPKLKHDLKDDEKRDLKKIPVLTCDKVFQNAKVCYFDSAILNIKGLESVITKNEIVSTKHISDCVKQFYTEIGVSKVIAPLDVIRRSVLRWIEKGDTKNTITLDNHQHILKYIAEHWSNLYYSIKPEEKGVLKKMPILTASGSFRAACNLFWAISNDDSDEKIPGYKDITTEDEFVSSAYDMKLLKSLLSDLGVHKLGFTDIYEKYSDHLRNSENVTWFFSQLVEHWTRSIPKKGQLLSCLQKKFHDSPCLLAKNGKMYSSTELYSSQFNDIANIDPNTLLLLEYKKLPEDLEQYLGFKMDLDFECIKQVTGKIPENGEKETLIFFTTLLRQLKKKDKHEIKENQLSLLSKENKLILAKDLYYFIEQDATCLLESCYLKRILGMSHEDTLELAELCGVNTLHFEPKIEREEEMYDNTLKEFYLERLPFIVLKESKSLNEHIDSTLKSLFNTISTIKVKPRKGSYFDESASSQTLEGHLNELCLQKQPLIKDEGTGIDNILTLSSATITYSETLNRIESSNIVLTHPLENEGKISKLETYKKDLTSDESASSQTLEGQLRLQKQPPIKVEGTGINHTLTLTSSTITCCETLNHIESAKDILSDSLENQEKDLTFDESASSQTLEGHLNELCLQKQPPIKDEGTEIDNILNPSSSTTTSNKKEGKYSKLKMYEKVRTSDESASSQSLEGHPNELCLQKQPPINDEGTDIDILTPSASIIRKKATRDSIEIEVESKCLIPNESETGREIRIHPTIISSTMGSSTYFPEVNSEQSRMKWLCEKYVFTFLQDHYKDKYPNSQSNLLDGKFTLQWQFRNIEIVWLNVSGEKKQQYDLLLKKDGVVNRLIEVQPTNFILNDSFSISHRKFIRKINQLATEFPEHKEKYCIYPYSKR